MPSSTARLPEFANPLFPTVIPGQHTFDRSRDTLRRRHRALAGRLDHADRRVHPQQLLRHRAGRRTPSGRTSSGCRQDLNDVDQEVADRGGVLGGPDLRPGHPGVAAVPADRDVHARSRREGTGTTPGPLLGVPVNLSRLSPGRPRRRPTRRRRARSSPARLGTRVRLIGSYQRASAESDTTRRGGPGGQPRLLPDRPFLPGLTETASTASKATLWRGSGRAEVTRHRRRRSRRRLEPAAPDARRLRARFDPLCEHRDVRRASIRRSLLLLLQAQHAMDRTVETVDVTASARGLGPVSRPARLVATRSGRHRDAGPLRDRHSGRPGRRLREARDVVERRGDVHP